MRGLRMLVLLVAGVVAGCSSDKPPEPVAAAKTPPPTTGTTAAPAAPTPPAEPKPAAEPPADADEFGEDAELPNRENVQLFAPPKRRDPPAYSPAIAKPAVDKSSPAKPAEPAAPPTIVLLGFVDVEGLQAILSINGSPVVSGVGPLEHGLELTRLEPPEVNFRFANQEFAINMFEQPLRNKPANSPPVSNVRMPPVREGDRTATARASGAPSLPSSLGNELPSQPAPPLSIPPPAPPPALPPALPPTAPPAIPPITEAAE